jgi:hypothetical protein
MTSDELTNKIYNKIYWALSTRPLNLSLNTTAGHSARLRAWTQIRCQVDVPSLSMDFQIHSQLLRYDFKR